jgi:hypothetical protein
MAKTFESRSVNAPTGSEKLYAPTTPRFLFMHHPNQWDVLETEDGYEVLPKLCKFNLIPGLNGIKMRPGGGADSTAARASFMDRGWVFIDNKKGGPDGYLREYDAISGKIYVDKWTTPRKLGHGSRAKVLWDSDTKGFNDFRRSLLEDGTIESPDDSALDFKLALIEKRIARKIKHAHVPQVQKQVDKITEKKEAIEQVKKTKKTTAPKRKRARKPAAKKVDA